VSRSDREKRDAERAARRANRLAHRVERRAKRKSEQAEHAAERADRLAERAQRRPKRERDLDQSIEDLVDKVTEKWTRKAGDWIDEQSDRLFDEKHYEDFAEDDYDEAQASADRARGEADAAGKKARRAQQRVRGSASRRSKRRRRKSSRHSLDRWGWGRYGRNRRRGNLLYRNTQHKKVCGVCAGAAEYFMVETWKVRSIAVLGLLFVPSVAIPVYFISYFLMDEKPYYRQVTDRFDDLAAEYEEEPSPVKKQRNSRQDSGSPQVSNREAMRTAKEKFGNIEDRLRSMETHVTSSTFELQREIEKISGEDG